MATAFPRTATYLACFVLATAWPGLARAQGAPDRSAVQAPSEPAKALSGFPLVKGSAFVGLTLNYTGTKQENIQSLLENVTVSSQKDMAILIDGGWFFRENAAVGIALGLGRSSLSKEVANWVGPATIAESDAHSYLVAPFIRYNLPMGAGHRFYLLTQLEARYSHDQGDESNTTGTSSTTSTLTRDNYGLVFTPGLVIFIVRGFALEATIGIGGIKYAVEKRRQEGLPDGVIKTVNVDFKINLLNLGLGIAYYF